MVENTNKIAIRAASECSCLRYISKCEAIEERCQYDSSKLSVCISGCRNEAFNQRRTSSQWGIQSTENIMFRETGHALSDIL